MRAGLLTMALRGCEIALLAGVSTGIYAGPHQQQIRQEFADLVNEILDEDVMAGGERVPLRNCFVKVVWTLLP